jgi:hypothetical protein
MKQPKKPKTKKGNPSWPSGKPKSLAAIDNKRRKDQGDIRPSVGAMSWPKWSLRAAKAAGQRELFGDHRSVDPDLALARQARRKRRMGVFA